MPIITSKSIKSVNENDQKIVAAIYKQYAKEPALVGTDLIVLCKNGYVTISGTVNAPSQEEQAIIAAKKIPNVRDAISEIEITTHPKNKID
jgi:osmotically-inducible protein OsmY